MRGSERALVTTGLLPPSILPHPTPSSSSSSSSYPIHTPFWLPITHGPWCKGSARSLPSGVQWPPLRRRPDRWTIATWLILPVVICLSQRLSHACLSINIYTVKLRMAH